MARGEDRLSLGEEIGPTRSRQRPVLPPEDVSDETRSARRPAVPNPVTARATKPGRRMVDVLTSREGLRRAIVAREILGPPKALRRPEDDLLS